MRVWVCVCVAFAMFDRYFRGKRDRQARLRYTIRVLDFNRLSFARRPAIRQVRDFDAVHFRRLCLPDRTDDSISRPMRLKQIAGAELFFYACSTLTTADVNT